MVILPGTPSCEEVPARPNGAWRGAPCLVVAPLMVPPSLALSLCGTLWNVALVKEEYNIHFIFQSSETSSYLYCYMTH